MSAAKYDLKIARGEDFSFTLAITDAFEEPVALDYNMSFKAEIREEFKKPLVQAFRFDITDDGISTTDNLDADPALATNELRFKLTSAETLTFDVNKKYKWDFFWTDSGSDVHKLLYGDVTVVANITNI